MKYVVVTLLNPQIVLVSRHGVYYFGVIFPTYELAG
jgi:hypothetical protein